MPGDGGYSDDPAAVMIGMTETIYSLMTENEALRTANEKFVADIAKLTVTNKSLSTTIMAYNSLLGSTRAKLVLSEAKVTELEAKNLTLEQQISGLSFSNGMQSNYINQVLSYLSNDANWGATATLAGVRAALRAIR